MRASATRTRPSEPTPGKIESAEKYPRLRMAVVLVWVAFFAYCLIRLSEEPFVATMGAVAIATAALLPAYLWASGVVQGLPILPINTLTFLWTHALPLVAGYPEISSYAPAELLLAATTVVLYCVLASGVWLAVASRPRTARQRYFVLPGHRGFPFFIAVIVGGALFIMAAIGQWFELDLGLFGLLRSTVLAFASIAVFVLAIRLGRGELRALQQSLFFAAMALFLMAQITTLFLVGAIVCVASALIGFTIGRGRVPWATIVSAVLVFGFLHGGKSDMREKYWIEGSAPLSLRELPEFFSDWAVAGARELTGEALGAPPSSLYERVGLMHLLLFVQRQSPDAVPFLRGATYAIVPRLLVPRIFDPDKPYSHIGTSMLNIHYGIQSEEDTEHTTVGWGLLNEAYANFGIAGVAGLAIVLGCLFGFFGRLTIGAPVMSLETMIGVTVIALAIQSEFTMGVFATVLFQSVVVLLLLVPVLELRRPEDAG